MPTATARQIVTAFDTAGSANDPSPAGWDGHIELGQPSGPGGPSLEPDRAVHRERERGSTRINNQSLITTRSIIAKQINDRLSGQRFPDQGQANLCGPAAFFYCLLQDRPDIYAQFVIDLWTHGRAKLGTLEIAPPLTLRQNTRTAVQGNGMDAVDWMTLGSLRAHEAAYTHPDTQIAAITTPGPFQTWFQAVGARPGFSNARIVGRARWQDLLDIAWQQGHAWVLLFIKAHAMDRGGAKGALWFPDHWVVLTGAVSVDYTYLTSSTFSPATATHCPPPSLAPSSWLCDDNNPHDPAWPIQFEAFSWGNRHERSRMGLTLGEFLDRFHGAATFSRIP